LGTHWTPGRAVLFKGLLKVVSVFHKFGYEFLGLEKMIEVDLADMCAVRVMPDTEFFIILLQAKNMFFAKFP
jgi:hypothetical protein